MHIVVSVHASKGGADSEDILIYRWRVISKFENQRERPSLQPQVAVHFTLNSLRRVQGVNQEIFPS